MALFARKGYAATSVREIVQEADVTNPMLYYYFKSKEGVFTTLIDILFNHMETQIMGIVADGDLAFDQKLSRIVSLHFEACCENPRILQFIYAVLFGPRESRPAINLLERRQATVKALEDLIEKGMTQTLETPTQVYDAAFLAQQFLGMINDRLMFALKAMEYAPDDQSDALLDTLLNDDTREDLIQFFFYGAMRLKSHHFGRE